MVLDPGFYYHYKHDSQKGIFDYAYEILNIAHHTEIADWDLGEMVIYRPLYESARVYQAGRHWDARPLGMFMENVGGSDNPIPRFRRITDRKVIAELEKQRDKMYK